MGATISKIISVSNVINWEILNTLDVCINSFANFYLNHINDFL